MTKNDYIYPKSDHLTKTKWSENGGVQGVTPQKTKTKFKFQNFF